MKKLLPLHYCETRQDALFLKQTLQESSNILVFIQRKENGFMLVADKNDYNIAKVIVKNKLSMLPSVLANQSAKESTASTNKKTGKKEPKFENLLLDLFSQLNMM